MFGLKSSNLVENFLESVGGKIGYDTSEFSIAVQTSKLSGLVNTTERMGKWAQKARFNRDLDRLGLIRCSSRDYAGWKPGAESVRHRKRYVGQALQ